MATVCVVDHTTAGGDILQANRRCAHYMGWDKEALCGRPLEVLPAVLNGLYLQVASLAAQCCSCHSRSAAALEVLSMERLI